MSIRQMSATATLREYRAQVVADLIATRDLDALLVTMFDSVRWVSEMPLCDYSEQLHDAFGALVGHDGQVDVFSMYSDQVHEARVTPFPELPHVRSLRALPACYPAGIDPRGTADAFIRGLRGRGIERLGVDELDWAVAELLLEEIEGLQLVPVGADFQRRRAVKHAREIMMLEQGAALLDEATGAALTALADGGTERDAGAAYAACGYARGVEGISHLVVRTPAGNATVAGGETVAFGFPYLTDARLRPGEVASIDAGFYNCGGYASDIARSIARGTPPDTIASAYERLCEAYDLTIEHLRAGRPVSDFWAFAHAQVERLGYRPYHKLIGHSIGLRVTETPMITAPEMLAEDAVLEAGMVVAVEFHVTDRDQPLSLEDIWVVTEGAPRTITHAPRSLTIDR